MVDKSGERIGLPVERIKYADLKTEEERQYRRKCPFCEQGWLLLRRDLKTGVLQEEDYCVFCGQAVAYDDIDELNRRESVSERTEIR